MMMMMPDLLQQLSNSFVADWPLWGLGFGLSVVAMIAGFWWKVKSQTARYLYNVAIDLYHKQFLFRH